MELARIRALPCWQGSVSPQRLQGGITNVNYVVEDSGEKFVVRLGGDIPVHQIVRFNELAASRFTGPRLNAVPAFGNACVETSPDLPDIALAPAALQWRRASRRGKAAGRGR